MSASPVTTDRSTQAALLALLDTMIADPYMFTPHVVASAAERARDMIVALDSSLTASEKRLAYCEANTIALDFRYGDKGQEDTVMVVRLPADGRYTTSFAKNIDAAMEKANG